MTTFFFDVALSIPPYEAFTYTYQVNNPETYLGYAVQVPIGNKRKTLGWIWNCRDTTTLEKVKTIQSILSIKKVFPNELLKFLHWLSEYYAVKPGVVCNAALPALDLTGTIKEKIILRTRPKLDKINSLQISLKQKSLSNFIKDLLEHPEFCYQSERLKRSKCTNKITKKALELDLIEVQEHPFWYKEIEQLSVIPQHNVSIELTKDQTDVLHEIIDSTFPNQFQTHLIFGVTGSGKTQIYIELSKMILSQKKSVLMIVPEIAMTPQLIGQFQINFQKSVRVLHSQVSDQLRAGTYAELRNGVNAIVIGARSAVFAPFQNLGLIIVDEEHEASLKQHDPEPRYHARDCAIIRAQLSNCPIILGSATPSIESFYNSINQKYKLHRLSNRVFNTPLPDIQIVDMNIEPQREIGRVEVLSSVLRQEIQNCLDKHEQMIILRNRRGYGTHLRCGKCSWVFGCPNCSVTLTYHLSLNSMICHLCGYTHEKLLQCKNCGSAQITPRGFGTERVFEVLKNDFPNARVLRFDADSVKQKGAHKDILSKFANWEADILVGTKMVARGLDFPNVTLSAILAADSEWIIPDFRSEERALTLFLQTAGRSGRFKKGKVIIQTWQPEHPIFNFLLDHNWEAYVKYCLKIRKQLKFPPFSRLIRVVCSSQNKSDAIEAITQLHKQIINQHLDCSEIAPALISKKENWFRFSFLIRVRKMKEKNQVLGLVNLKLPKTVKRTIDVDPIDFS
ncbi:MAG: primosomal protein N' [bacterium]|nr:primosomal protein N' [bacterium]